MYLTRRQLDEAVDQSCGSPTKLIRNLLMAFFSPSTLAASSCYGTRRYPALNKDIIGACFRKYMFTFMSYMLFLINFRVLGILFNNHVANGIMIVPRICMCS